MNVDEAMEAAAGYPGLVPLFCSEVVAITLAKEVERLRVWNKRWRDISNRLRRGVGNLEVMLQRRLQELASAKAATRV